MIDIDKIIEIIQKTPPYTLLIAVMAFIIAWIFRENRNAYIKSVTDDATRIKEILEVYSEIFPILCRGITDRTCWEDITAMGHKLIPICSKEAMTVYVQWQNTKENEFLIKLKDVLQKEIAILKTKQYEEIIIWGTNGYFIEDLINFIKRSNIKALLLPCIYTIFAVVIIFVVIMVLATITFFDIYSKISILMFLIFYVISLMSIVFSIECIIRKRISLKARRIIVFIAYLLVSILSSGQVFVGQYMLGGATLSFSTILYLYLFSKAFERDRSI